MANPQVEKGYIRIANELWNEVLRRGFSKRQQNLILLIWRLSYGTGQKDCYVPKYADFEIAGLYRQDVKKELKYLRECSVLIWDERDMVFKINKDYKIWQVSPNKNWESDKFNELIHQNLERKNVSKTLTNEHQNVSNSLTNEEEPKKDYVSKTLTFSNKNVSKTLTPMLVKHLQGRRLNLGMARYASSLKTVLKTYIKDSSTAAAEDAREKNDTSSDNQNERDFEQTILQTYMQLRAQYFQKGGFHTSPADQQAAKELHDNGIPLDDALYWLEKRFETYTPKHSRDSINSLGYCVGFILDRYHEEQEKQSKVTQITQAQDKQSDQKQYNYGF